MNIVQTAIGAGSFKTLVAAVQAAGLVETLSGKGPFTVFAPTDEAFAKLPKGTVEDLLKPENKAKLVAILTYHVVAGKVMSTDVVKVKSAKTVQGQDLAMMVTDGKVMINNAQVVKADIVASNGVIHVDRHGAPSEGEVGRGRRKARSAPPERARRPRSPLAGGPACRWIGILDRQPAFTGPPRSLQRIEKARDAEPTVRRVAPDGGNRDEFETQKARNHGALGHRIAPVRRGDAATMTTTRQPRPDGSTDSYLRVAHLSPDAPAVDVWVDGGVVLQDVAFGDFSSYLKLNSGMHRIQVSPANQTTPIVIDAQVTLTTGTYTTVAATGRLASIAPVVLDRRREQGSDEGQDPVRPRGARCAPRRHHADRRDGALP